MRFCAHFQRRSRHPILPMYGNSRTEVRLSPAKIRRRAQDLVPGSSAFLSLRVRSWQKKLWLGFDIALAQGTAPLAHACDGRQPGQALGPPQESEEQRQLPLLSLLASYGPAGGVTISSPPDRDIRGVCQGRRGMRERGSTAPHRDLQTRPHALCHRLGNPVGAGHAA